MLVAFKQHLYYNTSVKIVIESWLSKNENNH